MIYADLYIESTQITLRLSLISGIVSNDDAYTFVSLLLC